MKKSDRVPRSKQVLKVAMLGHKRIPSREGGVEIVVEELSTRMIEQGHFVTCYNRSGHHVAGQEFDEAIGDVYKGVKLKKVATVNKKGLAALTSSISASILASFGKFDIVHYHAEGPCAMMWLPKLFGKRCIATIHGLDWSRAKWSGISSKYIKFGEKVAVKCADEIIVLNEGTQNYFRKTYGRKTHFIPNGVSRPQIREAKLINEKYGLKKDSYVLFLGRIVPEKGISYLINAYHGLYTDKKLIIAGGASDSEAFFREIQELAEKNENIIFTGFVQGELLEELYSNAYIYILPSDLEGMPLSLLEAMSYGNCCLVSDIDECTEVVEDKAVIFEHGHVHSLRVELQQLCNNSESVLQYKKDAAEFICGKYSWDALVEQTLNLYQSVLRENKGWKPQVLTVGKSRQLSSPNRRA